LREKEYYWTVNIPNFYKLGFELLSIEYGTFNEAVPVEKRTKYFREFVEPNPNAIFSLMSRSNGVVVNVAKNYAEDNEQHEKLEMFFSSHHLIDEGCWNKVLFPFQTSMFWNFFNYSPIIKYAYDVQRKMSQSEFAEEKKIEQTRLSKKEKKVLYGLVKFPEESDNSIADRFKVSRQAVSSIKKRFIKEDLLSTQRIINLDHTGCNLLTFSYTFFGPSSPLDSRKEGVDYVKKVAPMFMGISSNFENVLFAATRSYSEYDKIREKLLSFYKSHMSIAKPPEILLFPVQDLYYLKKPTFHDLLQKTMGMK
jgi:hypothetical protein